FRPPPGFVVHPVRHGRFCRGNNREESMPSAANGGWCGTGAAAAEAQSLDRIVKDWMFPTELTRRSFQASNGEFGWSREDARIAISILVQEQRAILGGELWWVSDGARDRTGRIPQRHGPDAVYPWETKRAPGEEWASFVVRCADESLQAI